MNKKLLALVLVFVLLVLILLIVLSNRKGGDVNITPTPTSSNKEVNLIWWNLFEPQENINNLIERYEKDNPNVKIQYVQVGLEGVDKYREDLEKSLSDDDIITSPDIFSIHNTWILKFEDLITSSPDNLFSTSELEDFYPIVKSDFLINDKLYSLPLYLDTIAIIYNKSLLKERGYLAPSSNWNDFKTQAIDLTKKNNNKIEVGGFSAFDPATSEFYFEVMNQLLMQNGVSFEINNNSIKTIANDSKTADAISYYKSYFIGNDTTWDASLKKDIAAFLKGKLAMYAAPSWRLRNILEYNDYYKLNLDIGISKMPQLVGGQEFYWPSYWGMSVSNDSQYSEEAWKFIKFLTESTQLETLNSTIIDNGRPIGIIYPRVSMSEMNINDPLLEVYTSSLLKASNWKMKDGLALKKEWDKIFNQSLSPSALEGSINRILSN